MLEMSQGEISGAPIPVLETSKPTFAYAELSYAVKRQSIYSCSLYFLT